MAMTKIKPVIAKLRIQARDFISNFLYCYYEFDVLFKNNIYFMADNR